MAMVDVVTCCLQADLRLKSVGLVQRSLGGRLTLFCFYRVKREKSRNDYVIVMMINDSVINIILVLLSSLLLFYLS